MTLLLGPPSSGKTTLLLALAGKLDPDLKVKRNLTLSSTFSLIGVQKFIHISNLKRNFFASAFWKGEL